MPTNQPTPYHIDAIIARLREPQPDTPEWPEGKPFSDAVNWYWGGADAGWMPVAFSSDLNVAIVLFRELPGMMQVPAILFCPTEREAHTICVYWYRWKTGTDWKETANAN